MTNPETGDTQAETGIDMTYPETGDTQVETGIEMSWKCK